MNNIAGWWAGLNGKRWLFTAILAVVLIAIGALLAHRYVTLDREITNRELARRAEIDSLMATTLAATFDRLTDVGISLANRVRFRELVDAGRWGDAVQILRKAPEQFPFLERVFISDPLGTLIADTPHLPGVVGTNFAHRDWFKGVSRDWKPYISDLYRRSAEPRRNLIAVSVPIRGLEGRIAGILVLQVRQEQLFDWARAADPDPASRVLIVDGAWHAAFDSKRPVNARAGEPVPDPMVQRLAPVGAGPRIVRDAHNGEDLVFGYTPASRGWGVATLQSARTTFAYRDLLLRQLLLNSVLIGLLATGAIVVGAVVLLRRRRVEADRAHREERERTQAEQRAFLRQVIDLDRNLIFAKDREGRFTLVNQAVAEAYGTTVEELIGRTDHDFNPNREEVERFHQDDLEVLDNLRDKFIAEETITDAAGKLRCLQTIKRPILGVHGRADMILGVSNDITERKRNEATLLRFRTAMDASLEGIFLVDFKSLRYLDVNETACRMLGYSRDELLGMGPMDISPDVTEDEQRRQFEAARTQGLGEVMPGLEARFMRRKDGSTFPSEVTRRYLCIEEQELVVGIARDITERHRSEQHIRKQLEHLKLLDQITRAAGERQDLASMFQVVVRTLEDSLRLDFACVCLYDAGASALTVTTVGVNSEELALELSMREHATIAVDKNGLSRCVQGQLIYEPDIGQSGFPFPARLARSGLRSMVLAPLKLESQVFGMLVVARHAANAFESIECEFLRQLSEHVALAMHQAQLYGSLQEAYDDLRQSQQTAMQEERLRALGQMASGIAHDINNALSPVSLYTESLLDTEKDLSERARGYLETIQLAVEDVAQTVARMREFYREREQQLELEAVDLNLIARQVLDLTAARWRDMAQRNGVVIQAHTELAPDLATVMGVESEFREALTNLVFNAVDAMPDGGTLTLRTRAHHDAEQPGVALEVIDTGIGMDEETRQRCLEPFFTSKGERGTGLGLAMVFGMVQRHSCDIEIDSAPGKGTTVRLVFAVATPAIEPVHEAGGPETLSRLSLLLIDDDPVLIKSLRDALETEGHAVDAANGGEAGIAAFRAAVERGEPYAAVVTDLGMPYVDGRKVAAAIKAIAPDTPVIMLTGWGRRLIAEGDIPAHVDRVLAKPPKLREVRETLAQLCGDAAS